MAANNIRSFGKHGYGLNIPLSDWKDIPSGIKNDPDFIKLRLKKIQAKHKNRPKGDHDQRVNT